MRGFGCVAAVPGGGGRLLRGRLGELELRRAPEPPAPPPAPGPRLQQTPRRANYAQLRQQEP